jgi:hypothetical protein
MIDDMAKVTVTLYIDENDKDALQTLADAEERSLSQMAVLILKRAIKKVEEKEKLN